MYEVTVKWPDGGSNTVDGFDRNQARDMADFLWACNADDVVIRCVCGECDTCGDRAAWESM